MIMSEINPYQSPAYYESAVQTSLVPSEMEGPWVFQKGKLLVMHKHAELPDRCVKTNQPVNGLRLRRNLSWHPPLLYLVLFIGIPFYIIVAIALSKKATIELGLCKPKIRKRRWAILISWLLAFLGIFVFGSFYLISDPHVREIWMGWAVSLGLLIFLSAVVYGIIASNIVTATRITKDYVWLKGVHPDYLAELPVWPHEP
jgi:hypothetical protein